LPRDLADLKARIIAAVKNIDAPMLTCVWQELEYRIDVCRVTRGAKSNISSCQKNFISFPVAVNNSIKVGPLVFLLQMFVITEKITKGPVLDERGPTAFYQKILTAFHYETLRLSFLVI
jgi:hypothetical protein